MPDEIEHVGISVLSNRVLRFVLGPSHLAKLSKPERLEVQRQPDGGFILIPSLNGMKVYKGNFTNGKMQVDTTRLSDLDLTKKSRAKINLLPSFENGYMAIPAPPQDWCNATGNITAATAKRSVAAPKLANTASDIEELQAQIARAKALLLQIETRTGIKLTLDSDLRLVVG